MSIKNNCKIRNPLYASERGHACRRPPPSWTVHRRRALTKWPPAKKLSTAAAPCMFDTMTEPNRVPPPPAGGDAIGRPAQTATQLVQLPPPSRPQPSPQSPAAVPQATSPAAAAPAVTPTGLVLRVAGVLPRDHRAAPFSPRAAAAPMPPAMLAGHESNFVASPTGGGALPPPPSRAVSSASGGSDDAASGGSSGRSSEAGSGGGLLVMASILPRADSKAAALPEAAAAEAISNPPPVTTTCAPTEATATVVPLSGGAAPRKPLPRVYLSHEHPAIVLARLGKTAAAGRAPKSAAVAPPPAAPRSAIAWALDYVFIPLALPLIAAYLLAGLAIGFGAAFAVWPSLLLARRLYWACPFIPLVFQGPMRERLGFVGSWLMRLTFEGAHCITVVSRLVTLPLRRRLPDFYIAGFPKCGTTSMAAYLKLHPDLSGVAGMPGHEITSKESHFLAGILGRSPWASGSPSMYRSFFPTLLARWWSEAVRGGGPGAWRVFDATPTYACLPHVPARVAALTPNAKIVFMVREPTASLFSAESMLRSMGVDLPWSLARPLRGGSAGEGDLEAPSCQNDLLQPNPEVDAMLERLALLLPGAPLPSDLWPPLFYFSGTSALRGARYADHIAIWAAHFPPENLMVVDFRRFVSSPEEVVREVLAFVGADGDRYRFRPLPPGMATDYKGARMHPETRAAVAARWFFRANAALYEMLGLSGRGNPLGWEAAAAGRRV